MVCLCFFCLTNIYRNKFENKTMIRIKTIMATLMVLSLGLACQAQQPKESELTGEENVLEWYDYDEVVPENGFNVLFYSSAWTPAVRTGARFPFGDGILVITPFSRADMEGDLVIYSVMGVYGIESSSWKNSENIYDIFPNGEEMTRPERWAYLSDKIGKVNGVDIVGNKDKAVDKSNTTPQSELAAIGNLKWRDKENGLPTSSFEDFFMQDYSLVTDDNPLGLAFGQVAMGNFIVFAVPAGKSYSYHVVNLRGADQLRYNKKINEGFKNRECPKYWMYTNDKSLTDGGYAAEILNEEVRRILKKHGELYLGY